MNENFQACLDHVLGSEGGWSDHKSDPGGATMRGITLATYRSWKGRAATKADLRAIKPAEVAAIYRLRYWDAVRGDDLPPGLDLVAFDAAVNSGPDRGVRWLQAGVGAVEDGKIGPRTLLAAAEADPAASINRACDARLAFLRRLGTWGTFGRGWTARVASVRSTALRMAAAAVMKPDTPVVAVRPLPRPEPSTDRPDTLLSRLLALLGI